MVFSQRTPKLKKLISTEIGMDDLTSDLTTGLITLAISPIPPQVWIGNTLKHVSCPVKTWQFWCSVFEGHIMGCNLWQVLHFWLGGLYNLL
jgi:hypothetical protein